MNTNLLNGNNLVVSAGCHINDVMNSGKAGIGIFDVSAGCHINDVMNE